MHSTVERITPEKAKAYLDNANPLNRSVQGLTKKYAKTMLAGFWYLHHQGIAFDESGMLIDGHHRLRAIVESGVTIEIMVTRGCPKGSLPGIDRGTIKTHLHISRMQPGGSSREALEAARLWMQLRNGGGGSIADYEVWETARLLEPYWQAVSDVRRMQTSSGRLRAASRSGSS